MMLFYLKYLQTHLEYLLRIPPSYEQQIKDSFLTIDHEKIFHIQMMLPVSVVDSQSQRNEERKRYGTNGIFQENLSFNRLANIFNPLTLNFN